MRPGPTAGPVPSPAGRAGAGPGTDPGTFLAAAAIDGTIVTSTGYLHRPLSTRRKVLYCLPMEALEKRSILVLENFEGGDE